MKESKFSYSLSIMAVYQATLKGRDFLELSAESGNTHFKVIGCTELLSLIRKFQIQFGKNALAWPLPTGVTHSELLLKEVLLKAQGKWAYPYEEQEICHCRSVPTETVDQAVIAGAHQCQKVSRQTSASTACGACRPNVQKIIDFRLERFP